MQFDAKVLAIDPAAVTEQIVAHLRSSVLNVLNRRGAVVGLSGGVDSSVVLALCARAFGPERVAALLLQEKESSPDNAVLARQVARQEGVALLAEDITGALEGFGCYRRRNEAIRQVFPEYDSTYRCKISLPGGLLDADTLNVFSLTVVSPECETQTKRLPLDAYLRIVAATNLKQRTRMATLYYHAEVHGYAVVGTANRNERDQGFFVKYGDGGIDVDAIVHLYKTQIYALAEYLGIPEEIRRRPPTTDTYSVPSTQEEFFFRLPFQIMDLLWYASEHDVSSEDAAHVMGLSPVQGERAYHDFERKRRATNYLRAAVLTL